MTQSFTRGEESLRGSDAQPPSRPTLSDRLRSLSAAQRELLKERLGSVAVSLSFFDEDKVRRSAPRTDTELVLAGIWSEVLGVNDVGVDDNFFDLGGDSILSIRIVAKAHRKGLKLTSKQLFEYPTVAELARRVEVLPKGHVVTPPSSGPSRDVARLPPHQLSPEDFPEAELSHEDLHRILRKIQARHQSSQKVRELVLYGEGDVPQIMKIPLTAPARSFG